MWESLKMLAKPNATIALFGQEPFSTQLRYSNLKHFKYDWIWDKRACGNFLLAKYQPLRQYEIISVFGFNAQTAYYPVMTPRTDKRTVENKSQRSMRFTTLKAKEYEMHYQPQMFPKNILTFSMASYRSSQLHPTEKPVELLKYLVRTYSKQGETILDFCAGSGSLAEACKATGRKCILIEKDEAFCKAIISRLKNTAVQVDLFEENATKAELDTMELF